jgi:hypothetical protein
VHVASKATQVLSVTAAVMIPVAIAREKAGNEGDRGCKGNDK